MKLIYVAGPFRSMTPSGKSDAWGVQQNVMYAMSFALEVWKRGHAAICPHANTMFFQDAAGTPDSVWLEGDLEILRRCDGVLVTSNWKQSSGARAEVVEAVKLGIPVYYNLEEFYSAMENLERGTTAPGGTA